MKGVIRKGDIILAIVLTMLCLLSCWYVYGIDGTEGTVVVIEYNGELWGKYSLYESQTIEIETNKGYNQAIIENGKVYMAEANCPDHYCLQQHKTDGGIDGSNETIVCLPNRIVISVSGNSSNGSGFDAVAGR